MHGYTILESIVYIQYGSSQYVKPPSNLSTFFANELNSLDVSKPSFQVKGTSQQSDNYYHLGVVFCYVNNNDTLTGGKIQTTSGRLTICAQLSDQVNDANILLRTFHISLYLIDCFVIETAFPGSLFDLNIVSNATKNLQSKIGFPVLIVYIDNNLQNRWQLTFNYTFHPCQSAFFLWNNQQNSYASNIRYLAGNVLSKLYNADTSVCKKCNVSCYYELATKDWSQVKYEYISCLLDNIRQSYSSQQFNCFKKSPVYTSQPYCGNGIIEDLEECDCLIKVPEDCELNNCKLFACTLTGKKRKRSDLLLIFSLSTLFVVAVSICIVVFCVQKPKPKSKKITKTLSAKSSDSLSGLYSDNLGTYFIAPAKVNKNVKSKIVPSSLSLKSVIISDKPKLGRKSTLLKSKSKSKSNIGVNLRSKSVGQSRLSKIRLKGTNPPKTEQSKTQLTKVQQSKTQLSKTQLPKTEPSKTEPSKTQLSKTQLPKTQPSKTKLSEIKIHKQK